jgi:AraC family transcriptional regulator of adaptative response/methylated-DNA-[protein]-cysteine methyltransferase
MTAADHLAPALAAAPSLAPLPVAPDDAEAAPYHAVVADAVETLVSRFEDRPGLEELAERAGLSPFHFQRVFAAWTGITPKRFAHVVALGHARRLLASDASVLDAAFEAGLSGPSRLHDLFVGCEAMTPGEFKAAGAGLVIRWGLHAGAIGTALIGLTDRGVCWLSFVVDGDAAAALAEFRREWAGATLVEDPAATAPVAALAFGRAPAEGGLRLLLKGTNFQVKVWEALLRIPSGTVVSYEAVARAIGRPTAMRAVGAAVGRNPISLIIPCHRVIQKTGVVHAYRWGVARKRALLAWEIGRAAGAEAGEAA